LGAVERVAPATVLAGLLTRLDDPGGAQRAVTPGAPADLVLLRVSLFEALAAPDAELVAATLIEGRIVAGDEVVRA
ncbi:MAG: hypothetical protein QOI02_938, partial [Actinomycetota bacterium]|nr:hypothetical protein [Actinomycetota bacterium]